MSSTYNNVVLVETTAPSWSCSVAVVAVVA
jgi:hypothetical protein